MFYLCWLSKNFRDYASVLLMITLCLSIDASAVIVDNSKPNCDFSGLRFDLNFSGARVNACEQSGRDEYRLTINPEKIPAHHSPWYAFRVDSKQSRNITVYLCYTEQKHRYHPKLSSDGKFWQPMPKEDVDVIFKGKTVKLKLRVGPEPLWVSAQEIINNQAYLNWTDTLAKKTFLEKTLLGQSLEGRPIHKLETVRLNQQHYLVLVGRQHPPEVTGALAMQSFVERLMEDDKLAKAFRERYGIIIVPNLNPDGVFHGHWRNNSGGVDLNRDWGPFTQPETQLMRDELARFLERGAPQLDFFLDFHSTSKDVFYTLAKDLSTSLPGFTDQWLAATEARIKKVFPNYHLVEQPGHDATKPISKAYMYETFGIPAVTFEIGDETNRQFIEVLARVSAEEMMQQLLSYRKSAFPLHE